MPYSAILASQSDWKINWFLNLLSLLNLFRDKLLVLTTQASIAFPIYASGLSADQIVAQD